MNVSLSQDIALSQDGSLIQFVAEWRSRSVPCAISREALECHFWAPLGASEAHLLKAYLAGRQRIAAVVERRLLKQATEPIVLDAKHFA
jgi:hypothetical protein